MLQSVNRSLLLFRMRAFGLPLSAAVALLAASSSAAPASNSSSSTAPTLCFAPDFLFSSASSAYQVEGGYNASGKTFSIWDEFCRGDNGVPCANVAGDFFHRYQSDVALMASDGLGGFRFSVAWTRAMTWNATSGHMEPNAEGLTFYHDLVDELLVNGIQPVLTLYHWDLPLELQEQLDPPGWLNSGMAEHFNEYAVLLFREFGRKVKYWTTFNEPASHLLTGFAYGYGPPQLGNSTTNAYVAGHNVLLAHAAAVDTFKALRDGDSDEDAAPVVTRDARIGIVLNVDWGIPLDTSSEADVAAAERKNQFYLGWFLSPITTGEYPAVMRERVGERLPNFTDAQSAQVRGSYDLLMLNYYTSYSTTDCDSTTSSVNCSSLTLGWETDLGVDGSQAAAGARMASGSIADPTSCSTSSGYPKGYLEAIKFLSSHDPTADVLLTENGWCGNETIDNQDQLWYYRTHLEQVHKAIYEEDIPVVGYTVWSFMDDFEWTSYAPRFGMYHVNWTAQTGDVDEYSAEAWELARTPRTAAKWYANVTQSGCLQVEDEDLEYL